MYMYVWNVPSNASTRHFYDAVVTSMLQVDDTSSFEWVKQLRYYWDPDLDNCVVRMSNSMYIYGYEYLGASARLVITPLTVSTIIVLFTVPER